VSDDYSFFLKNFRNHCGMIIRNDYPLSWTNCSEMMNLNYPAKCWYVLIFVVQAFNFCVERMVRCWNSQWFAPLVSGGDDFLSQPGRIDAADPPSTEAAAEHQGAFFGIWANDPQRFSYIYTI
jgi:hypothetical protein